MKQALLHPYSICKLIFLLLFGLVCVACQQTHQHTDTFLQNPDISEFQQPTYPAPDWLRDAVIVEIPLRAFNHPDFNHPENWDSEFGLASYASLEEKLPLLKKFGVNVICLYTVYHHTPGTNLYAIRHHEAATDLGTLNDVKHLIKTAHEMGIQVISNTNAYGCAENSPMVEEHPDWFLPSETDLYGQRVFDVNHLEVVSYIIDTHAWWCTEVGLDGWRIDIAHQTYRKFIWDEVLQKCAQAGKSILLATEGDHLEGHIRGAGWNSFPVSLDMEDPMPDWETREAPYGRIRGYTNTTATDPYRVKDISSHNSKVPCPHNFDPDTCPREGAYQVQGSRFLFGHNLMFAPFVPWLMHGDLFNATHLVVPGVMGHRLRGKLLHAYIDWDDLEQQQAVIADFQQIMRIRAEHADLFHNNRHETHLINVPFFADPPVDAKPYVRFLPGEKAAIVVGNDRADSDVNFRLQIPLSDLGFGEVESLSVSDLWTGRKELVSATQLRDYRLMVPRDKTAGGGVRVLLLSPE